MNIIIGICGGSGSGKTYLSQKLKEAFKGDLSFLPFDMYCRDHSGLSIEELAKLNYDIPDAYAGDEVARDVAILKSGKDVDAPYYEFALHARSKDKHVHVETAKIIVVEGVLCFAYPEILKLLDYKIFVNCDEDVRYRRRLERDVVERGRTPESVNKQFYGTVAPMHNIYVEPTKVIADYVLENSTDEEMDINEIVSKINELLQNANN